MPPPKTDALSLQAFTAALTLLNLTESELVANTTLLCDLLELHIVPTVIPSMAASVTPVTVASLLPEGNVMIQLSKCAQTHQGLTERG